MGRTYRDSVAGCFDTQGEPRHHTRLQEWAQFNRPRRLADGTVKMFDRRIDEDDSVVRAYNDHYHLVQNVRWHPRLPGQFLPARCVMCAL